MARVRASLAAMIGGIASGLGTFLLRIRPGQADRRAVLVPLALAACVACQGNADFSDAMPAPVVLPAEAYQREIMDIDRLVFEAQPVTPDRRAALATTLEELSRRVKAGSTSRFLVIESLEIRRLAEIAKDLPTEPPPQALRNNWMRIRSNLFDDRAWFARSAADLPSAGAAVAR